MNDQTVFAISDTLPVDRSFTSNRHKGSAIMQKKQLDGNRWLGIDRVNRLVHIKFAPSSMRSFAPNPLLFVVVFTAIAILSASGACASSSGDPDLRISLDGIEYKPAYVESISAESYGIYGIAVDGEGRVYGGIHDNESNWALSIFQPESGWRLIHEYSGRMHTGFFHRIPNTSEILVTHCGFDRRPSLFSIEEIGPSGRLEDISPRYWGDIDRALFAVENSRACGTRRTISSDSEFLLATDDALYTVNDGALEVTIGDFASAVPSDDAIPSSCGRPRISTNFLGKTLLHFTSHNCSTDSAPNNIFWLDGRELVRINLKSERVWEAHVGPDGAAYLISTTNQDRSLDERMWYGIRADEKGLSEFLIPSVSRKDFLLESMTFDEKGNIYFIVSDSRNVKRDQYWLYMFETADLLTSMQHLSDS